MCQEIPIQERLRNSHQRLGCISTGLLHILVYGYPAKLLSQLQRVQNSAARLIHQSTRYSPSSPLLHDLHWLPIKYRCISKILLITFKAIHGHAPSYIQDLVKVKHQTRTLRSSTATYLDYPSIKSSKNLGERSFYIAAPTEWNRLPANIRNSPSLDVFKKRLKTHPFTKAFDTWYILLFLHIRTYIIQGRSHHLKSGQVGVYLKF